jgi:hypothetical protein
MCETSFNSLKEANILLVTYREICIYVSETISNELAQLGQLICKRNLNRRRVISRENKQCSSRDRESKGCEICSVLLGCNDIGINVYCDIKTQQTNTDRNIVVLFLRIQTENNKFLKASVKTAFAGVTILTFSLFCVPTSITVCCINLII